MLTSTIRKSERLYYARQFELNMNNTRVTCCLINSILQTTHGIKAHNPIIINCGCELIKDSNTIANKFNVFFSSIGSVLASNITSMKSNDSVDDYMPYNNKSSMYLFPCTNVEIENIIRDLSNTKSIGVDGFSMKVNKSIISNISVPLSKSFNSCLIAGIFQDLLNMPRLFSLLNVLINLSSIITIPFQCYQYFLKLLRNLCITVFSRLLTN